jgi:hypothetical protein
MKGKLEEFQSETKKQINTHKNWKKKSKNKTNSAKEHSK